MTASCACSAEGYQWRLAQAPGSAGRAAMPFLPQAPGSAGRAAMPFLPQAPGSAGRAATCSCGRVLPRSLPVHLHETQVLLGDLVDGGGAFDVSLEEPLERVP